MNLKKLEELAERRNEAERSLDRIRQEIWTACRLARDQGFIVEQIAKALGMTKSALYKKAARSDKHGAPNQSLRPKRREDRR
jgi:hypothetical protein